MQKILIATGNQGKAREMLEVLSDLPFEFITLKDLGMENDADECGKTHEENALIKAYHFHKKTGLPTIGEDSGIWVQALEGELGIHTRRWGAGEKASDEEWLDYFLKRLSKEENRKAKFFCASAFVFSGEEKVFTGASDGGGGFAKDSEKIEKVFTGETEGELTQKPMCPLPKGIPISALFVPAGAKKVYAMLSEKEKNQISHRGKAMHELKSFLSS